MMHRETLIDSYPRLTDGIVVGETERVAKTDEFVDGSWNINVNGKSVPQITTDIFHLP